MFPPKETNMAWVVLFMWHSKVELSLKEDQTSWVEQMVGMMLVDRVGLLWVYPTKGRQLLPIARSRKSLGDFWSVLFRNHQTRRVGLDWRLGHLNQFL